MQETPASRLARWWTTRNDRPAGIQPCGHCGTSVPEADGYWLRDARSVACSEECAEQIALNLRA